jgi:hypothetical protein
MRKRVECGQIRYVKSGVKLLAERTISIHRGEIA